VSEPNGADAYQGLAGSPDFVVRILWSGPEDKPFYRQFHSESRPAPSREDPFHGYAAISRQEFAGLLQVLRASGLTLAKDRYSAGQSEYHVEIEVPRGVWHVALGFNARTLEILLEMETALKAASKPIADVIARTTRHFQGMRTDGARGSWGTVPRATQARRQRYGLEAPRGGRDRSLRGVPVRSHGDREPSQS
jgi:hypothetical protein